MRPLMQISRRTCLHQMRRAAEQRSCGRSGDSARDVDNKHLAAVCKQLNPGAPYFDRPVGRGIADELRDSLGRTP